MNAFSSPLPGKRRRTIAIAQMIPNTVFSGTAIAAMMSPSTTRNRVIVIRVYQTRFPNIPYA